MARRVVPPARANPRDPWRRAPVGEMEEQLLPRWFVLTAVALVPVVAAAAVAAFLLSGPRRVPVAARRPPPAAGLTTAVGASRVGDSPPQPYAEACPALQGIQVAGTGADRAALRRGIAGLCNTTLPQDVADRLRRFADAGGVVRFAQFEATGVDSTARLDSDPPVVLVNAKLQRVPGTPLGSQPDPLWIAPLVAHDTTYLDVRPGTAEGELAARSAEDLVCDRLLAGRRESRGCQDAEALLAMPDPLAALRDAGFR